MDYNSYLRNSGNKSQKESEIEAIKGIMLDYIKANACNDSDYYNGLKSYVERGGHYMRSRIFLRTAKMFGVEIDNSIMKFAAAIELLGNSVLMFDDVEDHSPLRRGKPTIAEIYGNERATNFATVLYDISRQLLEEYIFSIKDETIRSKLWRTLNNIAKETGYGQDLELRFTNNIKDFSKVGMDYYFEIAKRKTAAYSVYGPMQLAAVIANAGDKIVEALKSIGEPAGIAFQINDDIMDFMAEQHTGKEQYGDLYEGKYTLIMAYAYSKANPDDKAFINSIYAKSRKDKTSNEINRLAKIAYETGAIEYALEERDTYMKKAISILTSYMDLFGPTRDTIEFAAMVVNEIKRNVIDIRDIKRDKKKMLNY
ncbi:MAG: polyprenyl synthetase family protein [Candidatus Micrarchaeia archaeon]